MKVTETLKKFFSKKGPDGKTSFNTVRLAGLIMVAMGNVAAIAVGTLAWFNIASRDSLIDIVSGDLNIEVRKVSAYKYVYPYYKNSTEYIDYDSDGTVKKFVLDDYTLTYQDTNVKDIPITSDDATVTLGTKYGGTSYKTTNPAEATSNNVCIPAVEAPAVYKPEFRYYLVGDSVFAGVESDWSLTDGYAFALREDVTNLNPAVLDNIVVSEGASFRLLECKNAGESVYDYYYFPLDDISEEASPFRVIDDNADGKADRLFCLRSGIYKFTYSPNQLKIELRTKDDGARKDISVITNNSLDPTKISIDYAGSVDKTDYPTINSYMPSAIYNQNTAMIIDAELYFKNTNDVEAGLRVERSAATSNSIFNIDGKYTDTTQNLVGYVDEQHQNPLRASDFYNYYAVFTKTPYANTNAIWTAMHRTADANSQKFINGDTYDTVINCTLNTKEENDSIVIPAVDPTSEGDHIYHCYIVVEYDYEHNTYFLDKNRLGKTYILDRDFGFHFFGVQHSETQS